MLEHFVLTGSSGSMDSLKTVLTFEACTTSALTHHSESRHRGLQGPKKRGVKNEMISKLMVAVMVGAAFMFGAAGVVSAAGANASGDCDQTQDQTRLQLKDGSCCECDSEGNDFSWNHYYNWNYNYSGST
jgi:uncharacterized protein (DUF2147 family)